MNLPNHKDYDHAGLTKPVRRPITAQEKEWINTLVLANKDWADATIGNLFVDGECACGCRTIHLEHSAEPQNPKTKHLDWDHVGEIWIYTDEGKRISIGLFSKNGTLCELEVVCEEGTEPMPSTWREVSRKIW